MKEIQSIGIYCSSAMHVDCVYDQAALAEHHITMVYGGGIQGLM